MSDTYFDIDDHKADPMIADWADAHAAGYTTDLERANKALLRADLCSTIIAERGDDLDKAQAEAIMERVALAAAACATACRIGDGYFAEQFANQANSEVVTLTSFDYVNVA